MAKAVDPFDEEFWDIKLPHNSNLPAFDILSEPSFQDPKELDHLRKGGPPRRNSFNAQTFLFPIDETEEFHDPFSDLSLYLSKRIKKEILKEKNPQKWSKKIQALLIKEILPDFTKKFPRYRLGNAALQKTWSKVLHYLQLIHGQKEALQPNGKLNIEFMIRENLKVYLKNKSQIDDHPYNQAHGLAIKISECVAAVDGERFKLDELTKMIWGMQSHLISKNALFNAPTLQYNQLDKLIVRSQLEMIAENPSITQEALSLALRKKILNIKQLQRIRSIDDLSSSLSAILATKLYPSLGLLSSLTETDLTQIKDFIKNQIQNYHTTSVKDDEKHKVALVERILFLSKLAFQVSKEAAEKNLSAALHYVRSLSKDGFSFQGPVLKQEVYHFIESELKSSLPQDEILKNLMEVFSAAQSLPKLGEISPEELEVLVWKIFHEEQDLLQKIPSYLKDTIISELANVHIDHCEQPFQKIIQTTLHYFKKIREIETSDLDEKLKVWTPQNDMICSSLFFDQDSVILKNIKQIWKEKNLSEFAIRSGEFVEQVLAFTLKEYPSLKEWSSSVKHRVTILFKYYWYTSLAEGHETSFDRFIKWHSNEIIHSEEPQFLEVHFTTLEQIIERLTPLAPFDLEHCRALFPLVAYRSKCQ